MGIGKVLTISGIACALVGGFFSEIGKDTWSAAKTYFNARVEITFKDPNAKKEVAQTKLAVPAEWDGGDYVGPSTKKELSPATKRPRASYDFFPDTHFNYYPDKPAGKRSEDLTKPSGMRLYDTEWVTTGFGDAAKPHSYDYSYPVKPTGKRSDTTGWYSTAYVDSYPAQNR